jgi:hypothetical protein
VRGILRVLSPAPAAESDVSSLRCREPVEDRRLPGKWRQGSIPAAPVRVDDPEGVARCRSDRVTPSDRARRQANYLRRVGEIRTGETGQCHLAGMDDRDDLPGNGPHPLGHLMPGHGPGKRPTPEQEAKERDRRKGRGRRDWWLRGQGGRPGQG